MIDNTVRVARNNEDFCGEDYKNSEGLLICGKCHTPREKFLDFDKTGKFYERYKNHPFPVLCRCRKEKIDAEEEKQKRIETEMLINKFRKEGIADDNFFLMMIIKIRIYRELAGSMPIVFLICISEDLDLYFADKSAQARHFMQDVSQTR